MITYDRLDGWRGRRRNVYFHVAPRYTAGSPAMVDETTAMRVAAQEDVAYPFVLKGYEGEQRQAFAQREGLDRIAVAAYERRKHWLCLDLITGEELEIPFTEAFICRRVRPCT